MTRAMIEELPREHKIRVYDNLVLYDDVINNRPVYQKKTWIIWFIKTVNKQLIQVELRNPMDGVNFNVPARRYMPPEFPFTELK